MTGARGERTIQVDGREVTILFTNRALMTVEKQLGKGILSVLNGFMTGGSMGDLVALLRAGMEAARLDGRHNGKSVSNDEALEVIDAVGFVRAAQAVMEAVADVIGYSGEAPEQSSGAEKPEDGADPN